MYYILKILNNNALLAKGKDGRERILLGKGIGFGKKNGDTVSLDNGVRVYTPAAREKKQSAMQAVNQIDPVYIEAAGRIIEEAEKVFDSIHRDILLPLADHIAFAVKRQREDIFFANPFIQDIKILFGQEYAVAMESRKYVEEITGYRISDDEAGFLALHIHSGLSGEHVSDTLKTTQIIDESFQIIEKNLGYPVKQNSMSCVRLMSHLYCMVVRARTKEKVNLELNEFVRERYPQAGEIAALVCHNMSERLGKMLEEEEIGFLAIHIQRIIAL